MTATAVVAPSPQDTEQAWAEWVAVKRQAANAAENAEAIAAQALREAQTAAEQVALTGRSAGMAAALDLIHDRECDRDDAHQRVLETRAALVHAEQQWHGKVMHRASRQSNDARSAAAKATREADDAADEARRAENAWNSAQEAVLRCTADVVQHAAAITAARAARGASLLATTRKA